ncbi:MAG: hypothetical protein H6735_28505 [Alphaproteobacteria bacterium]|nr:hypothetical protein [Alphaproteobacteria bacterium]
MNAVVLFASVASAFSPSANTDYVMQQVISTDGYDFACGLTSETDTTVDCLNESIDVRFEKVSTNRYRVKTYRSGKWCYLDAGSYGSGPALGMGASVKWTCSGTGDVFETRDEPSGWSSFGGAFGMPTTTGRIQLRATVSFYGSPMSCGLGTVPWRYTGDSDMRNLYANCTSSWGEAFRIEQSATAAPDYTKDIRTAPNGCSSPTELDFALDGYDDLFRPACDIHDWCWATPWMSTSECNEIFYDEMLDICGFDPFCIGAANNYLAAVDILGDREVSWLDDANSTGINQVIGD